MNVNELLEDLTALKDKYQDSPWERILLCKNQITIKKGENQCDRAKGCDCYIRVFRKD